MEPSLSPIPDLPAGVLLGGLVEDADDFCAALAPAGEILYANGALIRWLAVSQPECRGALLHEFIVPADRQRVLNRVSAWRGQGAAGTLSFDARLRSRAGEELPFEWSLRERPAGVAGGAVLCVRLRDISERLILERKVMEEEIWYRTVLASVLEPVVTMNSLGIIQSASDSVEDAFGWKPQELVGRNVATLMPEPHRSVYEAYLSRLATVGSDMPVKQVQEYPVMRRDGTLITSELAITRFELPDRAEPFFTGAFRDVTARKRAEDAHRASEEILGAVFDNEYKHRCIVSSSGQVLRVNRTCLSAMDAEADQILGLMLWELPWWGKSPVRRAEVRDAVSLAAQGKTERYDFELHTANKGLIKVDLVLIPIRDSRGEVRFLYFEARDVTREREVEEAERTMLSAFAEIGESAAEVIHEIKNPISGINIALRALARELKQDERAVLEELASRLSTLEIRLRRTLQFARPVKAKRLPLSATAVLNRAIEGVRPAAAGWSIAIESELPQKDVHFYGDPALLHEALVNLLLNALECGTTRVRAGARGEGDRVSFIVEDAGPGIPLEKHESIFKPFITSKLHGSGIGLTLVRKAAETHGGSISVDRGALGGARFTLLVPSLSAVGSP